MSYIKIIYKDEEINYNGSLQGAIESAFRYDPSKSGYIEVLDGNITENIQLYHGVNLYFANGVTFKGTMTDGGKGLTAVISGNGTLTTFGTGNVFNIQNSNSNIVCNCNIIDGSTSAVTQSTLSIFANDGRLAGSSTASSSGSTNLYTSNTNTFINSINNVVAGDSNSFSNGSINNIVGGTGHSVTGALSNTIGGYINRIFYSYKNIIGGSHNVLTSSNENIVGGISHLIYDSSFNSIIGSSNILNNSNYSMVGGFSNELHNSHTTIVGGLNNSATAKTSIIYGEVNSVTGIDSIVGGAGNSVTGNFLNVFGVNCSVSGHSLLVNGRDNVIRQDDGIINGDGITSTSAYHTNIFGNSIVNTASSATLIGRNFTNSEPNATVFQYGSAKPNFIINNVGATGSRLFVLAAPSQTNEVATKGYVDTVAASGSTGVTSWGSIIGTLSAQTDLVTELALKPNLATANTYTNGTQTFNNNTLVAGTAFFNNHPQAYGNALTAYPASSRYIPKWFADTEYTLTGFTNTVSSNLNTNLRIYTDTVSATIGTYVNSGRFSLSSHNHNLNDLSEKSYYSLSNRPDLSVTGAWIYV